MVRRLQPEKLRKEVRLAGKTSSSRVESLERLRNLTQSEREMSVPTNAEVGQLFYLWNNLDELYVQDSLGKDSVEDIGVLGRLATAEKRFDSY